MEEIIISFETAKIAKEKGFDWCVLFGYKPDGSRVDYDIEGGYYDYNQLDQEKLSAPTQALLQRWLREVHNIHVSAFPVMKNRYFYSISTILDFNLKKIKGSPYYSKEAKLSYEEALEKGLQESLKLIKTSHL